MPLHKDFEQIKREMIKKHGDRGEEVFYKWVNKHGLDDTKPLDKQKKKLKGDDDSFLEDCDPMKMEAGANGKNFITIPAFKMSYVAAPKTGVGDDFGGPITVKAITLEEITNINGWRVVPEEFERVAAQYREGRQLRLNHSKDVQEIIGRSFDSKVLMGSEIAAYMGKPIAGISPSGKYVVTEFEADPQDKQVRTNILRGYVDTGSIGLDAKPSCDECGEPLIAQIEEMVKTCRHSEAGVKLTDVDVKEYSYVSEPAFEHSKILPSFASAVSRLPKPTVKAEESSLSNMSRKEETIMSTVQATSTVEVAAAKKAEPESEAEGEGRFVKMDAETYAQALLKQYKQGIADAVKLRADDRPGEEPDEDDKKKVGASVKASVETKTDQVAKSVSEDPMATKDSLMDKIWNPTAFAIKNSTAGFLFKAAAEHPQAPPEIRKTYKKMNEGRFE